MKAGASIGTPAAPATAAAGAPRPSFLSGSAGALCSSGLAGWAIAGAARQAVKTMRVKMDMRKLPIRRLSDDTSREVRGRGADIAATQRVADARAGKGFNSRSAIPFPTPQQVVDLQLTRGLESPSRV